MAVYDGDKGAIARQVLQQGFNVRRRLFILTNALQRGECLYSENRGAGNACFKVEY